MPPKRTASSKSKRKPSPSSDSEGEASQPKKAKVTKKASGEEAGTSADNPQPTNKEIPEHIEFPAKVAGTTRIASWNVSGLAAAQKKVRLWCGDCIERFLG